MAISLKFLDPMYVLFQAMHQIMVYELLLMGDMLRYHSIARGVSKYGREVTGSRDEDIMNTLSLVGLGVLAIVWFISFKIEHLYPTKQYPLYKGALRVST
ncbi:hypothetical protein CMV_015844 [Castanea mollissima]|uniref:Uncharacterized protein n=1 Tax=Castanea mollissima TaxID=60419 RepID=A0A8J4VJM5_9ROSI|nr:hypothetical protein CMV_015844 [Castanea mollissima]